MQDIRMVCLVYIYACPSKYGVCLSCTSVNVHIAAYCKIKNDIFSNEWLVIELKAIKWQGSSQLKFVYSCNLPEAFGIT